MTTPANLYWFGLALTYAHVCFDPGRFPVVSDWPLPSTLRRHAR